MSPMSQYKNECAANFFNEKRTPAFQKTHNAKNRLTKQPFSEEVPL